MAREDWRDRDERRSRDDRGDRDDFGQADYSESYGYDSRRRAGYRADEDYRDFDDRDQADYSREHAYDAEERRAVRRQPEERRDDPRFADRGIERRADRDYDPREPRSWIDRAEEFFTGHPRRDRDERPRRRGPSDRVLWAVIMERLDDERGLDMRDVDVGVHDGEVTLNGTVRHKADKRRIEDIADIDGVHNVQNNLRVRDRGRGHWAFI